MKFRHISASTSKHGGVLGQRSEREATGKSINLYHFCCHCLKKLLCLATVHSIRVSIWNRTTFQVSFAVACICGVSAYSTKEKS